MVAYTRDDDDLRGVRDPDFLALGLGGTSMMAMLWAVAMGRRAVGVEMRGDPFLGVHWNIRADLYHQFGLIDSLMLERYGEDRVPRRGDGKTIFRLAETFYSTATKAGDIVADEIIDSFDVEQHIAGTIHHVEFIDDRWRDGVPNRVVSLLTPPSPPAQPDPMQIRTSMIDVLDGPSTFQAGAASVLVLLRRYLEKLERLDLDGGFEPRVRLFTRHRVMNTPDGFIKHDDGRIGFRIEALQELDYRGKFVRVRRPGSQIIEIGTPELFMIAQGFHSTDAERLGFRQEDVAVDHQDGRGPVVAQADFLAGLVEMLVGGRLRRRISSEFDDQGNEYWVRQIAVGHEDDPEVGWCLVQVPDFKLFDPIREGIVPEGTDTQSPEFFAGYESLVYDFYTQQVGDILEMPKEEIKKIQMVYGPKLFTLIERMGDDALLAPNGVVAGDSFGNGHFLTSGGAMTGMSGHSWRVYEYYQARDAGIAHEAAIRTLADAIKDDTLGWLHVSAREYSEALPINFGAERIAQLGISGGLPAHARAAAIDATRRQRHSLLPLDPSDWRRVFLRNGRIHSAPLPELHAMHPALRGQRPRKRGARTTVAFVTPELSPTSIRFIEGVLGQPGVRMGLIANEAAGDVPARLRERLTVFARVADVAASDQIVAAIGTMSEALGPPMHLLSHAAEVQGALAEARARVGCAGTPVSVIRDFDDVSRQRQKLNEAGVPVPRYARIESVQDGLVFGTEIGYFPLLVRPNQRARGERIFRVETEEALRTLLEELQPSPENSLICEELIGGAGYTLDVITIDGVPAWYSAMRLQASGGALSVILPREGDDPADPLVRRIGFAAVKALDVGTGLSSMRWLRRPDGSPVVTDLAVTPSAEPFISLKALAHDADLYRAWGNVVVNGLFAPIPRLYAAGAAIIRARGVGSTVVAVHGVEEVVRELGSLVAKVLVPQIGEPWSPGLDRGYLLVRHAETAVVADALQRISEAVWIELGDGDAAMAAG